jgi:hypothetical protein
MPKVWNKHHKNVPEGAIYVGRPTKWGNPYVIGRDGDRNEVIRKYRKYIIDNLMTSDLCARDLEDLRGKDLVCWCAPKPCHADILLEIANS